MKRYFLQIKSGRKLQLVKLTITFYRLEINCRQLSDRKITTACLNLQIYWSIMAAKARLQTIERNTCNCFIFLYRCTFVPQPSSKWLQICEPGLKFTKFRNVLKNPKCPFLPVKNWPRNCGYEEEPTHKSDGLAAIWKCDQTGPKTLPQYIFEFARKNLV